jgi:HEAT repeat protein
MILERGRPLRFAHPIVRTAVYEAIPTGRRSDLHARAAGILSAEGAAPETVAAHLLNTDPCGDPNAVTDLREAASRSVARGAPEPAGEFLRRALAEPPPAEVRPDVLRELGSALTRVGDPAAGEVLDQAFELAATPEARVRAAFELTETLMIGGRSPAVAVVESILDEVPDSYAAARPKRRCSGSRW